MSKPGPKPKVTPEVMRQVYAVLKVGGSLADAAGVIGCSCRTLRNARRDNPDFSLGIKRAIRDGKVRLLSKMGKAKAWQAAAWMLERRWGKQFGRKDRVSVTNKGTVNLAWSVNPDGRVSGDSNGRVTSQSQN